MFMANPDYFAELKIILKRHQFSVIQVNNGLHGWEYTEQQYGQSLPKLMDFLKKYGRGATIVWATTTPRRSPQNPAQLSVDNDRVKERNRIAVEYMTKHGIAVDDLYSLVADHPEYYRDDHTHFNDQGRAVEGKQVSEVILQALKGGKR
jgi:lysophospholipase L1-like esterase